MDEETNQNPQVAEEVLVNDEEQQTSINEAPKEDVEEQEAPVEQPAEQESA